VLGSLGWEELVLILAIVALIAGGGRVADLGGSLGRGVREFRRGVQGEDEPSDAPPATIEPSETQPETTASGTPEPAGEGRGQ
jgi:sec-independent protein translocase protein TatA